MIDLDHPEAPKAVNLILKALESLTRAANASEQILKSDAANKKKTIGLNGRSDDQLIVPLAENAEHNRNAINEAQQVRDVVENQQQDQEPSQGEGDHDANPDQSAEQDMGIEVDEPMAANVPVDLGMDFMREDIEGNALQNNDQIEMTFHVENRADDEMGDEDDDMGDEGDDDEDDDEGEDEDEDIVEDGRGMLSLADTDGEEHDDAGLADDYNDEMIDEDDDDLYENRVVEVRWREALDGLDHLQVLGQPGAASSLIDISAEPFEGVNVDDLFGFRRPLGFERRRQAGRSSFERAVTENGFQHPLLSRPPQTGDLVSMWSSGGSMSRDLEALSSGGFDVAHFYMFDAPVLPYDHVPSSLFGERLGGAAPPPLTDYSVGMDSLQLPGRRGLSDGRWTDDGQPQASANAAAIAQAVEEHFLCHLHTVAPADTSGERQAASDREPNAPLSNDSQVAVDRDNSSNQQSEGQQQDNGDQTAHRQPNSAGGNEQVNSDSITGGAGESQQPLEPMSVQPPSLNSTPSSHDSMEIGDGNGAVSEQVAAVSGFVDPSADVSADSQPVGGLEVSTDLHDVPVQVEGSGSDVPNSTSLLPPNVDVDMNSSEAEENENGLQMPASENGTDEPLAAAQDSLVSPETNQADQASTSNEACGANAIDPTFLEALPEDLRAEVLASQQAQPVQPPAYAPPSVDDIDPEFLAALPPDIQAEVLAQQRAQRMAQQAEGQPVDMDNASIIATFPADLREEVCFQFFYCFFYLSHSSGMVSSSTFLSSSFFFLLFSCLFFFLLSHFVGWFSSCLSFSCNFYFFSAIWSS